MSTEECKDCHDHEDTPVTAVVYPDTELLAATEPLKERPVEEVTARLAQQDQEEKDILTCGQQTTHTNAHIQENPLHFSQLSEWAYVKGCNVK